MKNNKICFWSSDIKKITGQAIVSKHVFYKINSKKWLKLIYPTGCKFIFIYIWNIFKLYFHVINKRVNVAYVVPGRSVLGFLRDIPILLVSFINIRIILHIHGAGLEVLFKNRYIGFLAKLLYTRTEIIFPSKHLMNLKINPHKIYLVENFFINSKKKKNKLYHPKKIKILWNSNVMATKGIKILVEGLECLNNYQIDFKLTILGTPIGDSIMRQTEIEEYLCYLKTKPWVDYIGVVPPNKTLDIIFQHDIAVLTSRDEGQPLAIINAMCCGLKLLVSDIPGHRYTILNYPAYFVKKNKNSIAKAFLRAFNDPPIDKSFRLNAIKRFSYKRFNNEIKEILNI